MTADAEPERDAAADPIWDPETRAALDDLAGGDPRFLAHLLDDFRSDVGAAQQALDRALAAGDAAACVECAHSVKGTALGVGAARLAAAALALERAARAGASELAPLRSRIAREVEQFLRAADLHRP